MTQRVYLAAIVSAALSASCAPAQSQGALAAGAAAPQNAPALTGAADNPAPAAAVERGPDKWMTADVWPTFNGDLEAQKFSPATQITPDNVGGLKKVWETHTGDVSDGSHGKPATVWSATPLFVNDTLYLGTPFYRIFALEPDTGKVKWTYDTHAVLKALTQPDLKNRGVAYWQAEASAGRRGLPEDASISARWTPSSTRVDADTGKPCAGFRQGRHGRRQPVEHDQRQMAAVAAAAADGLSRTRCFSAGPARTGPTPRRPPGTVFALDARTGRAANGPSTPCRKA